MGIVLQVASLFGKTCRNAEKIFGQSITRIATSLAAEFKIYDAKTLYAFYANNSTVRVLKVHYGPP